MFKSKLVKICLLMGASTLISSGVIAPNIASVNSSALATDMVSSNTIFNKAKNGNNINFKVSKEAIDFQNNSWVIDNNSDTPSIYFNNTKYDQPISHGDKNFEIFDVKAIGHGIYFVGYSTEAKILAFFGTDKLNVENVANNFQWIQDIPTKGNSLSNITLNYIEGFAIFITAKDVTSNNWVIYTKQSPKPIDSTDFSRVDLTIGGDPLVFDGAKNFKLFINNHEQVSMYPSYFIATDDNTYIINYSQNASTANKAIEVKSEDGTASLPNIVEIANLSAYSTTKEAIYLFAKTGEFYKVDVTGEVGSETAKVFKLTSNIPLPTGSDELHSSFVDIQNNFYLSIDYNLYVLDSSTMVNTSIDFKMVDKIHPKLDPTNKDLITNVDQTANGSVSFVATNGTISNIYQQLMPSNNSINALTIVLASIFGTLGIGALILLGWYLYIKYSNQKKLVNTLVAQKEISSENVLDKMNKKPIDLDDHIKKPNEAKKK